MVYMDKFKLVSKYKPTGDQPQAIDALVKGVLDGDKEQTLMGVTGSGKTLLIIKLLLLSFAVSLENFFPIMQLNILFLIMIIISRRLMFRQQIRILKKIPQLTMK